MPEKDSAQAKRGKILAIAIELFLEKGYGGASMSELLRLTGGSKTTIYTYFGDKAGLFTAIIDELLRDTVAFSASPDLDERPVRDALLDIANRHLEVVLTDRYIRLVRIVAAEVERFPELGRAFYEHGPGCSYANFKRFLDERTARGEFMIDDTSRATDTFFGTLLHREVLSRLYGVETARLRNLKRTATAVVDEFLHCYGSRGPVS